MERKYAYYEIVKALEDCSDGSGTGIIKATIDLIKRQKAEIERLNKEVDRLSQCVLYHEGQIIDAIKEFAERLLDEYDIWTESDVTEYQYVYGLVNNLVKETTNKLEENNNER